MNKLFATALIATALVSCQKEAPERTDTSRAAAGSPKRLPVMASIFARPSATCAARSAKLSRCCAPCSFHATMAVPSSRRREWSLTRGAAPAPRPRTQR